MRSIIPITLPVFIMTEDDKARESAGMDLEPLDVNNNPTRQQRFYCIDSMWPWPEAPHLCTMIICSGGLYTVKMKISEIEYLIEQTAKPMSL